KRPKDKASVQEKTVDARNEGTDLSLAYQPPSGAVVADYDVEFGEFDYDAVKNDPDAELWLVRVPANVKPKHLENVRIALPASSRATTRVGLVPRAQMTFDVWASIRGREADGGDDEGTGGGGDELSTLSVLLPREKKGGKLYIAPKPVTRHLVVAAQPARPSTDAPPPIYQNPPRQAYPLDVLTHCFIPYGSGGKEKEKDKEIVDVDAMDVDAASKADKQASAKQREEKGKKRKVEADADVSPKVK
ncbi:hypothetical protein OF83DRAFT_1041289, partial [Amylostereum chailletii]